ncbi:MAG TPA: hypothetical protein VGL53_00330 [Bryobacteraceae bacterium]|jgi:hypothetical protein
MTLTITGEPLDVTFNPAFVRGATLVAAQRDGVKADDARVEATPADVHVLVKRPGAMSRIELTIRVQEDAEATPVLVKPEVGDPARR